MDTNMGKQPKTGEKTFGEIFKGVHGYNAPYKKMKADLSGRVAFITGGSGMVGGESAALMAASGAAVVLCDVWDGPGQERAEAINDAGGKAVYLHVNVTDEAALKEAVEKTAAEFGQIDILMCNAGPNFGNRMPIAEFDDSALQPTVDGCLMHTYHLCRLVLPYMIRQGKGSIINTTSVCGVTGLRRQCPFIFSKFAISALTRSMALEYGKYNIRVNAIAPGSLPRPTTPLNFLWDTCDFENYESNFSNPSTMLFDIPMRRPAAPQDMAGLVLLFASDDAGYLTGQVVCVDGGWTAGYSGDY